MTYRLAVPALVAFGVLASVAPLRSARAQATAIPGVVTQGLDSLIAGNGAGAVRTWGRTWTGDDTLQTRTLLSSLEQLAQLLGQPQGYDLARLFDVGPSIRHAYVVVRYNKQPLYAHFIAYRPAREWQVINVSWNTDPTKVFPESLLVPPG